MNNQLMNLVNCVMYDRHSEFQVIVDQIRIGIIEIKLGREQKNLIAFLSEQNKIEMLRFIFAFFDRKYKDHEPEKRGEIFRRWLNQSDLTGLTPMYVAVYHADLVSLKGIGSFATSFWGKSECLQSE